MQQAHPVEKACASFLQLTSYICEIGLLEQHIHHSKTERRIIYSLLKSTVQQAQSLQSVITLQLTTLCGISSSKPFPATQAKNFIQLSLYYSTQVWNILKYPSDRDIRTLLFKILCIIDNLVYHTILLYYALLNNQATKKFAHPRKPSRPSIQQRVVTIPEIIDPLLASLKKTNYYFHIHPVSMDDTCNNYAPQDLPFPGHPTQQSTPTSANQRPSAVVTV